MPALITGGNGFVGSHLKRLLPHAIVCDPHPPRFLQPPKLWIQKNYADLDAHWLSENKVTAIYHLASTTIHSSSVADPVADISQNLIATVNLLENCVQANVKHITFLSSAGTVYGVPQTAQVLETHPTAPISPHGIVKLSIEKYLHYYARQYGLTCTILRAANPFGPWQNPTGGLGAIVTFLYKIANAEPISIWGDGSVVRDYFAVQDLARACILATEMQTEGVYNIGSGVGRSLNDVLRVIEDRLDLSITNVNYLPERSYDVPQLIPDISSIKSALDWAPQCSFETAIHETWQWVNSLNS